MIVRVLTFAVGICAGLAAHFWRLYPAFSSADAAMTFGGTVASISTTMLGFILAALAILASVNHTHLIGMMREYGHYTDLLQTMSATLTYFLGCAVLGLALLFGLTYGDAIASILIGFHAAAFLSLLDVGRKLRLVLANLR